MSNKRYPKLNKLDKDVGRIYPQVNQAMFEKDGHCYDQEGKYLFSHPGVKPLVGEDVNDDADKQETSTAPAATETSTEDDTGSEIDLTKYDFAGYAKGEVTYPWLEIKKAIQARYGVDVDNKKQAIGTILEPPSES